MQRPRREDTESATRTRTPPSTHIVDVIVLSTDPALIATLREAAGPAHRLLHAPSAHAAVELLVNGHHGILIVDIAVVGRESANLIDKLQTQFPEILLLATGRRDEQIAVAAQVTNGRIYRFLHKPVSPARADVFLSTATRRYGELHPHPSRATQTSRSFVAPRAIRFALIGAAVALLGGGAWLWSQHREVAHPTPVVVQPEPPPSATDEVSSLIAQANAAREVGRLAPPLAGNAFDLFASAQRLDPTNQTAAAALSDIIASVEQRVVSALAARDRKAAESALASLRLIAPGHPGLAKLQTDLAALSRATPAARPAPSAVAPAAAPTSSRVATPLTPRHPNLDLANTYLAANRLIEPEDANAFTQLRRAREANEDPGLIQIAATALGTQLSNQALAAIATGNVERARAAYESAVAVDREFETAHPDLERVASSIRELDTAKLSSALNARLERISRLRTTDQLIEPEGDNAYELLQALAKESPDAPAVKSEQQLLSFSLLERTRTALAAGDVDRADILATRAEETLPGLPQTKVLREQIGAARQQRDDVGALVQAASLPRRREVPAVYPRDALMQGVDGWVDLEFTIDEQGVPTDVTIKDSRPRRVFDSAATSAMRQWRFEPVLSKTGTPRVTRATLRMEFKLKD